MINHSDKPNSHRAGKTKDNCPVVASVNIKNGEEITEDYWLLPDWNNHFLENQRVLQGVPTKEEYDAGMRNEKM